MSTLSPYAARRFALAAELHATQRTRAEALVARVGGILSPAGADVDWVLHADTPTAPATGQLDLHTLQAHAMVWHRAREVRGLSVPPLRRSCLQGMRLRCYGALRTEAFIESALHRAGAERVPVNGAAPTHVVVGRGLTRLPPGLQHYRDGYDAIVLSEAELLELIEIAVTPLALDSVQREYLNGLAFARAAPPRFAIGF